MKAFLTLLSGIILFSMLSFQADAKDHGHGHGHGKGNGKGKSYPKHYYSKHYYKKNKHYCNVHCHHGVHHYYREKVVIVEPAPQPRALININL